MKNGASAGAPLIARCEVPQSRSSRPRKLVADTTPGDAPELLVETADGIVLTFDRPRNRNALTARP